MASDSERYAPSTIKQYSRTLLLSMVEDKQSTCLELIATGTMAYFIICEAGIAKCFCSKCQSKKRRRKIVILQKRRFLTPPEMSPKYPNELRLPCSAVPVVERSSQLVKIWIKRHKTGGPLEER